jgi:hypothetical protein
MVLFAQHIIFPMETQFYIGLLILVLFLLVLAILFVGVMIQNLVIVVQKQSEMLVLGDCAHARKVERKE